MTAVARSCRAAALAAAFALSAGLLANAGAPVQQATERPLTVDFYALGADGTTVADLKAEEVTVRVNGRARAIQSLRLVKQADPPPADPLAARVMAAPEPFATNGIAEAGRTFVIVIDDESFRPGREKPIRAALGAFLGALSPRDRVSLWTVPRGGMKVNLTTNHDRVSQAVQIVVGNGPERETGQEAACRTRTTLEEVFHLLETMEGGEGPTTVMVLTNGLLGPRRDGQMTMAPGMCEIPTEHFTRIGRAAAAARAHFFIVQPEDLVQIGSLATEGIGGGGFTGNTSLSEGLENLAGVTGGTRIALARAGDVGLLPIAKATTSYYSAVVDPSNSDIDGALGLDVRVARPGITVRSRASLFIRKAAPTTPARDPAEMIKVSTPFPDLRLRATSFHTVNDDGRVRVIAAAEPADPSVKFAALSAALYDSTGRMVAQTTATAQELTGTPVLSAMAVGPGIYRMRVAATDANGRGGAADTEVNAEIVTVGPLRLSSLVLGVSRPGASFAPRLQFGAEPVAIAYVDVFGGKKDGLEVGAIIEVAQTVNGEALAVNRVALDPTSDPLRFRATGVVPLGALPPGDYIARVTFTADGQFGRVYRAFRKAVQ
jgi:hypothetical protein